MDGPEGEAHPERISVWWLSWESQFCDKVMNEILGHSRFYAGKNGEGLSRLFRADKLSIALYPIWLYLLLGNLSGEIHEYMTHASVKEGKYTDVAKAGRGQIQWFLETRAHMILMALLGSNYPPVARQMGVSPP